MTRNELITKWCDAEGGKVSALNAPQAREAYAKLRAIIGDVAGIDLDDVIKCHACYLFDGVGRPLNRVFYRTYKWVDGKPAANAARK